MDNFCLRDNHSKKIKMERRDILKASAIFLGYSLVGGASVAVLNGCKADVSDGWKPSSFSMEDINMLAEVAERIIPKTDTPGAKDALVHRYLDEAVTYNFDEKEKQELLSGIKAFDDIAQSKFSKKFVSLAPDQMDQVIQQTVDDSKKEDKSFKIFPKIKGMVAAGYFTSEVGATQSLVYDPVPGPFQGCIPLDDVGGVYAL